MAPTETLIHADIFFFITSIAVVLFIVLMIVGSVYIVRILKNAAALSDTVRREGEHLAEDFSELRVAYKAEGMKLKYVLGFITKMLGAKDAPRTHRAKKVNNEAEE